VRQPDITLARAELGGAQDRVVDGLKRTIEWFRTRPELVS